MVKVPSKDSLTTSLGEKMSDEADIKSAVEAAFGPGAFDVMDDDDNGELGQSEPAALEELSQHVVNDLTSDSQQRDDLQPCRQLVFEVSDTRYAIPVSNVELKQPPRTSPLEGQAMLTVRAASVLVRPDASLALDMED